MNLKYIQQFNEELRSLLFNESYKNLFNSEEKQRYKDVVFELFQNTYKNIGGLKGSGFKSSDDMVANFPMWKLNVRDGNVIFAALYKDKQGRKCCAAASNGSRQGLLTLKDFLKSELITMRSWSEISGPVLKLCQKWYPELLNNAIIDPKEIKKIDDEVDIIDSWSYTRPLGNG